MVLFASKPTVGDWEADWDTVVPSLTEDKTPRFILYRLDTRSKVGWEWTVIEWIPDGARVRDKMLYAASKATLTKTLGQAQFTDSVYATVPSDVTLESYKKHLESKAAGGPLSETEKLLQTVKMEEAAAEQIMQRRTPVPSARVTAPIDADTKTALERFDREGDRLGLVVLVCTRAICGSLASG